MAFEVELATCQYSDDSEEACILIEGDDLPVSEAQSFARLRAARPEAYHHLLSLAEALPDGGGVEV